MAAARGDLYELLGVSADASVAEIRRRYLELAQRYHPDRHEGNPLGDLAHERLGELNQAYAVLSDPALRAAYDARNRVPGSASRRSEIPVTQHPRGAPGSAVFRTLALFVVALVALRFVPGLGRGLAGFLAQGPGRAIGLTLLAVAVIGGIFWLRARRSRGR